MAVSDDFDRADGVLGADWTALVGTWAVVSNQAECNDDNGGSGYYARYDGSGADVGSSDMYAEVVTNSTQTNGSSNTGPSLRMRAAANTSYQFPTNLNDSCSFWRINAGAETQIATFTTTIAVGDTVRLEACGRTFRFKVNGQIRNLLQDTNITDGQRGGLNGYNNVGTDVVRIDNFAAGPLTDLTAPYLADWSAQTARTTGTPSTPTIPAQVAAGDLVVVPATVRATTSNIAAPAGEGWSQVELASGNSLRMYAFAKIWGLGDTDDTTPSFAKDAGTVGFFTHALIFRNPAHATAPWTSVASAIVASNQQSNAAAATATAPSVTHDGTHRTIVRLFSSADDNALNAPSEGVLVTGGAAYDATDIAQACSVLEDTTVTTSTGTATVTESVNGNDASNGITLVLAIPSGTAVTGTAALTGTGSLAASGVAGVVGTAGLSGGGSLSAAGQRGTAGTAAAAAAGSLTAAGVRSTTGTAVLAGTGVLTAIGVRGRVGSAAVTGTGTLVAEGDRAVTGTAGITGGSLTARGVRSTTGQASLTGTGSLAATGAAGRSGTASLAATGSLAAAGTRGTTGVASAAATGSLTATGEASSPGEGNGTLNGTGTLSAGGVRAVAGLSSLAGSGTLTAIGTKTVTGSALFAGVAGLTASGVAEGVVTGAGALIGGGLLSAAGRRAVSGRASITGAGVLVAVGSTSSAADPNPTIVRLRDRTTPTLADPAVPRLREPR